MHLPSPFAADLFLYLLGRKVWKVAGGTPGVSAEAEEIRILPTFAARVPEAHASAAAVTCQRPLEEVIVFPAAISGDTASRANPLHFVPGVVVDNRLVRAVVDDTAVHDLPDVVRVAKHAVHLRVAERTPDVFERLAAAEPSFFEEVFELRDAGLPFGVEAESPADVLGPVGIDHDAFHLASVDPGDRVEVAERGDAVGTAALGFLRDPLLRFVREVGRVVLGHAGHDGVLELSGRGVVDVLRDGDEHRSGALDRKQDRDVIGAVTGQAVELVHNDIADIVLSDEAQHLLQPWTVCGAS
nr:hypothetical protein [Microbacterium sp. cx-59]